MRFSVLSNHVEFTSELTRTHKQMIFAEMVALNRTARDAKDAIKTEMRQVFDRPTPWSLNAFQTDVATRSRLRARIEQRYAAGGSKPRHWFEPNVYGGPRSPKAFEKALAARLGLPVSSTFFLPGPGARMNAYGNLSSGQLGQILSDLGARQVDPNQNATDKSRRRNRRARHFVQRTRDGKVMIMLRKGALADVVLTAVSDPPSYEARFDFFGVIERTARARFPMRLDEAVRQALATARPAR